MPLRPGNGNSGGSGGGGSGVTLAEVGQRVSEHLVGLRIEAGNLIAPRDDGDNTIILALPTGSGTDLPADQTGPEIVAASLEALRPGINQPSTTTPSGAAINLTMPLDDSAQGRQILQPDRGTDRSPEIGSHYSAVQGGPPDNAAASYRGRIRRPKRRARSATSSRCGDGRPDRGRDCLPAGKPDRGGSAPGLGHPGPANRRRRRRWRARGRRSRRAPDRRRHRPAIIFGIDQDGLAEILLGNINSPLGGVETAAIAWSVGEPADFEAGQGWRLAGSGTLGMLTGAQRSVGEALSGTVRVEETGFRIEPNEYRVQFLHNGIVLLNVHFTPDEAASGNVPKDFQFRLAASTSDLVYTWRVEVRGLSLYSGNLYFAGVNVHEGDGTISGGVRAVVSGEIGNLAGIVGQSFDDASLDPGGTGFTIERRDGSSPVTIPLPSGDGTISEFTRHESAFVTANRDDFFGLALNFAIPASGMWQLRLTTPAGLHSLTDPFPGAAFRALNDLTGVSGTPLTSSVNESSTNSLSLKYQVGGDINASRTILIGHDANGNILLRTPAGGEFEGSGGTIYFYEYTSIASASSGGAVGQGSGVSDSDLPTDAVGASTSDASSIRAVVSALGPLLNRAEVINGGANLRTTTRGGGVSLWPLAVPDATDGDGPDTLGEAMTLAIPLLSIVTNAAHELWEIEATDNVYGSRLDLSVTALFVNGTGSLTIEWWDGSTWRATNIQQTFIGNSIDLAGSLTIQQTYLDGLTRKWKVRAQQASAFTLNYVSFEAVGQETIFGRTARKQVVLTSWIHTGTSTTALWPHNIDRSTRRNLFVYIRNKSLGNWPQSQWKPHWLDVSEAVGVDPSASEVHGQHTFFLQRETDSIGRVSTGYGSLRPGTEGVYMNFLREEGGNAGILTGVRIFGATGNSNLMFRWHASTD